MTQHVVAITGLSGVGKSALLQKLAAHWHFQHLQASALIRAARTEPVPTVDHLRLANLDENQQMLVQGFAAAADRKAPLVVLDAHTLIELPQKTVLIEPDVFGAIGINSMVFLTASAREIMSRRMADKARQREGKSVEELERILRQAQEQARHICQRLGIPLLVVDSSDYAGAAKALATAGAKAR